MEIIIKDFEIDGEYNDMEMVLEEQCNEMKSDDNQLDMYIDNIKKETTKHNDQTNHVKIALDIGCIDDNMGEMCSVYAKEYKKKVEILTKKRKIELNDKYEQLVSDDVKTQIKSQRKNPYSCTQCTKSFTVANSLKIHLRTHSVEKPYPCTQCTKSFSVSSSLKIHLRTHSGEKPYPCTQCTKSLSV